MNLELRAVSKKYSDHDVNALRDVSLRFATGDFVAVCGPSGCGKSTLLNIVGMIDRPTTGTVIFGDDDVTSLPDEKLTRIRGERIGFVFQFFNLLSTMTVEENVALPLEIQGKSGAPEIRSRVQQIIERVGMSHRAGFYPSQLSGGEMQRTAIARAVIHQPKIVVADEPTGNLDSENGNLVLELLKELNQKEGQTIVMATHSLEAASYASCRIDMRDGKVLSEER